jgi:succinate dehydrogenase/fumarate reductase cytochrome b subunit
MSVDVWYATNVHRISGAILLKLWTPIDMLTLNMASFYEHLHDYRRNYTAFQQEFNCKEFFE